MTNGRHGTDDIDQPAGETFVQEGDQALEAAYDEPMSLATYVETLFENPDQAAHAAKYLLDAIEAAGTRTVVEEGEHKRRYRFFDDPHNDGEHAVLGNTETLNAFVEDLRSIAAGRGKGEKMIWFAGPTATGKSELKRCLINGLREYSKTDAGRRYTVEWNVSGTSGSRGLSYGENDPTDEDDWHVSPVQTRPLAVFPDSVRADLIEQLDTVRDGVVPLVPGPDMDPFSREAYAYLEDQYRRDGVSELFSAITNPEHLRVKNYVVDVGQGIGILHAEDEGTPTERLVGAWMPGLFGELDSRGRKDPRAFSYDGVLSQGNSVVTIIEDAAQHADLLRKLLNVPDEGRVKLDTGIELAIDTQLIVISNPDLEATLNQHAEREDADPLKALKRRLDRHDFTYLTNLSLEAQLLRRELAGETTVWEADDYNALDARIREPLRIRVRPEMSPDSSEDFSTTVPAPTGVRTRELAPHAIEAAALYDVVSRLDDGEIPANMDLVDKALLFDRGYIQEGDQRLTTEDVTFDETPDGRQGIPVTFTRDILADLLQSQQDRSHPEYDVADVIMPRDVLNAMVEGLFEAPVFSNAERSTFESRVAAVKTRIFDRQSSDVIDAIMYDHTIDEELIEEYVEHVYAWATDEPLENDRGERIGPDPLTMKIFEVEHLGRFEGSDYTGSAPSRSVKQFRREQVITALNRHAWEQRGEDFAASDVDLTEIPVIEAVLESDDWADVRRIYEDLDPDQWADPPTGTETATVKDRTIDVLVEEFGYSPASAELTSRHVMTEVSYQWD